MATLSLRSAITNVINFPVVKHYGKLPCMKWHRKEAGKFTPIRKRYPYNNPIHGREHFSLV